MARAPPGKDGIRLAEKILLTGGAGFIGSHIVDALIKAGHKVAVVDNLSTGKTGNLNPKATFYNGSIVSSKLGDFLRDFQPEVVIHQAANTIIQKSVADPTFDAEQNIIGSLNLIALCIVFGVKKIVFASSGGAVYGEPAWRPVGEAHRIRPLSPYGVSKRCVELYLEHYAGELSYTILRYANVYGPRQNPHGEAGVVAIFRGQMLAGQRPTIFGDGSKTRDYVHVFDVAQANLLAVKDQTSSIYNIGTEIETSDQQIFDMLASTLGYKGKPKYIDVRKGEVRNICLDFSRARKGLGWVPKIPLEKGIGNAIL